MKKTHKNKARLKLNLSKQRTTTKTIFTSLDEQLSKGFKMN